MIDTVVFCAGVAFGKMVWQNVLFETFTFQNLKSMVLKTLGQLLPSTLAR